MPPEAWRGGINLILYGLQFTPKLGENEAAITADAIIEYRTFGQGPRFFLNAIQSALATDAVIMTEEWDDPPYGREDLRHSEEEVREFLAMVAQNLIRRRPWPSKQSDS